MQQKRTFLALAAAAARRATVVRMVLHDGVAGCHGVLVLKATCAVRALRDEGT